MRRTLIKLGIGCQNLSVETGRYDKIPLDERIFPLCSGNKIEDETHLSLESQRYSSMRDIFLSKIETKIDDIRKLSHENLISISQLMNSIDYCVNFRLIIFISLCFEMRCKFIWPLLKYWINVMIYINVEIVLWLLNHCNYNAFDAFAMLHCSPANKAHCCCCSNNVSIS